MKLSTSVSLVLLGTLGGEGGGREYVERYLHIPHALFIARRIVQEISLPFTSFSLKNV